MNMNDKTGLAKSGFLTELDAIFHDDAIYILAAPLIYWSALLDCLITVPVGFQTDLASVPRLPVIYTLWGDRAHREAVLHDYLYRIDSRPVVSESQANGVFLEAMESRGVVASIRWPMYWGVCAFGWCSYHRKKIKDELK